MAGAFQRTADLAVPAVVLALVGASVHACLRPQVFACESDGECMLGEREGRCIATGFCAYPDEACDSALRFGPAAGAGMAGECVPEGDTEATAASDDATGCGPCDEPPDRCHLPTGSCQDGACVYPLAPRGTECGGDDSCVHVAQCDAAGSCEIVEQTLCNDPPGPCHEFSGECFGPNKCSYVVRPRGAACEDGDGCTLDDRCDGEGTCVSLEECGSDNPCAVGSCGATQQCSFFPVVDGTQCGPEPIHACCSGACVNLEQDATNCGGCGVVCTASEVCSTLQPTPTCVPT